MTRTLIAGVCGKTGAPLAELVADRDDLEVLGGSSDPSTVTIDGAGPTALSWGRPAEPPLGRIRFVRCIGRTPAPFGHRRHRIEAQRAAAACRFECSLQAKGAAARQRQCGYS
jgi:hypothetical protein